MADGNRCDADSCEKPTRTASSPWCEMHYYRLRRNGTLSAANWHRRGQCIVEGCEDVERFNGYCARHETRVRRHGDPLVVVTPSLPAGADHVRWAGDGVGYSGAHRRVRDVKGPAATHQCVDCDGAAAQWSYDHADPNEKHSDVGAYSADVEHYQPRCVPCHKAFDLHRPSVTPNR